MNRLGAVFHSRVARLQSAVMLRNAGQAIRWMLGDGAAGRFGAATGRRRHPADEGRGCCHLRDLVPKALSPAYYLDSGSHGIGSIKVCWMPSATRPSASLEQVAIRARPRLDPTRD